VPSAPRVLMHVPPAPPPAPLAADVALALEPGPTPADALVRITFGQPPKAHKSAVGRYRLAAWTQWTGGSIDPIRKPDGTSLEGAWPSIETGEFLALVQKPADADADLTIRLALVDPVGRMSAITSLPLA
jgi:hypothetical protein